MGFARRLTLSHRAADDLLEIWLFTAERWGAEQADRYTDAIRAALTAECAVTEPGRVMAGVEAAFRFVTAGQHFAFFTWSDDALRVERILHRRMDPRRHLR